MKVRLTLRALAEAKRIKTWWLRNRPKAPHLFDEELSATLTHIQTTPNAGSIYPAGLEVEVRRMLMPKTHNHIYYAIEHDEVVVLSLWGARRGRTPRL
jgi:plasmid stabilization system protein ParE